MVHTQPFRPGGEWVIPANYLVKGELTTYITHYQTSNYI